MKKMIRKGTSLLLVLALLVTTSMSIFATTGESVELDGQTIEITPLTDSSCMLSDGNDMAILSVEKTDKGANVVLTENGKKNTFIIDQEKGTIYSPFTKQTVKVDRVSDNEDSGSTIIPHATGKTLKTYSYKFSYKKIAEITGTTTDAYGIASALVTLFLAASGLGPIPTLLLLILGGLRDLQISMIIENVKNNAPGGIKVTIRQVEITKHQGGRVVKGVGYKLDDISTYK